MANDIRISDSPSDPLQGVCIHFRSAYTPGYPHASCGSGRKPGARVTNSARLFTPRKRDSISEFKSGCHREVAGHLTDLKKYGCLSGVEEAKITKKNM